MNLVPRFLGEAIRGDYNHMMSMNKTNVVIYLLSNYRIIKRYIRGVSGIIKGQKIIWVKEQLLNQNFITNLDPRDKNLY